MDIEHVMRTNQLLGFYGALLTDKQQQMVQLYYAEDFSLAEIADHYAISRQAVRDNLKRAEAQLEHYEAQLHLIARRKQRVQLLAALAEHVSKEGHGLLAKLEEMDQ